MKKSILIVLGVIVFVGLTVTTVSAKVITMDGVKYQLFQDPDSGEYTLLPLNQPKKTRFESNETHLFAPAQHVPRLSQYNLGNNQQQ